MIITAKLLKVVKHPSRYGGYFYYLFFKSSDGKSFRSCLHSKCINFQRWLKVLSDFSKGQEIWLTNLITKGKIIDADSDFKRL